MGNYLDMVNNDKPNPATGRTANENYARELLQLFSIGVFKLNPNGTLKLDLEAGATAGSPIPTYDQDAVEGLARVFTGWTYDTVPPSPPPTSFNYHRTTCEPMVLIPTNHDVGRQRRSSTGSCSRRGRRVPRTWPRPSTRSSTTRTWGRSSAVSSSSTW